MDIHAEGYRAESALTAGAAHTVSEDSATGESLLAHEPVAAPGALTNNQDNSAVRESSSTSAELPGIASVISVAGNAAPAALTQKDVAPAPPATALAGPDQNAGAVAQAATTPGQELMPDLRSRMQSRFGHDFSRVRIHTEARAAESARAVGARGYTIGSNIVFAPGQFSPETPLGERLLTHELTHVVQQERSAASRAAPGAFRALISEPGDPAEREASAIAELNGAVPAISGGIGAAPAALIHRDAAPPPAPAPAPAAPAGPDQNAGKVADLVKEAIDHDSSSAVHLIRQKYGFSSVSDDDKFKLIGVVMNTGWVGPEDIDSLVKIWESFGPGLVAVIEKSFPIWTECVRRTTTLGGLFSDSPLMKLKPIMDVRKDFETDVRGMATDNCLANQQFAKNELVKYGMFEDQPPPDPSLVAETPKGFAPPPGKTDPVQDKLAELHKLAKVVQGLQGEMTRMRNLVVGWDPLKASNDRSMQSEAWERFNPDNPPLHPLDNTPGCSYKEIKQHWDEAAGIVALIASQNPTIFAAVNQAGVDPLADNDPAKDQLSRATMVKQIWTLLTGALRAARIAEVNIRPGGDSDYRELKVVYRQILAGQGGKSSTPWTSPVPKWIAEWIVKDHQNTEEWKKLGIEMSWLVVVAVSLATPAGAAFIVGQGILVGTAWANMIATQDKYDAMASASKSQMAPGTGLVFGSQVTAAEMEAKQAKIALAVTLAAAFMEGGQLMGKLLNKELKVAEGLTDLMAAAKRGGPLAAEDLAKALQKELVNASGDVGSIVSKLGGDWQAVAQALARDTSGAGVGVLKQMQTWRRQIFEDLGKKMGVKLEITGTASALSDVDVSVMGSDSNAFRSMANTIMEQNYGSGWRKLLDADIFSDPTRLHLIEDLAGKAGRDVQDKLMRESELNYLAKMMRDGVDKGALEARAADMHISMGEVQARKDELVKLAGDQGLLHELEAKMDGLHAAYLKETDPAKKAALAQEMAITQGKLNSSFKGAYSTPGGVAWQVTRREGIAGARAGAYAPMSPTMGYMALLDNLSELQAMMAKISSKGFTPSEAKAFIKYANRVMVLSGQFGVDLAELPSSRALADALDQLLASARVNPAKLVENAESYLKQSFKELEGQLDHLRLAVRDNADRFLDAQAAGEKEAQEAAAREAANKSQKVVTDEQKILNNAPRHIDDSPVNVGDNPTGALDPDQAPPTVPGGKQPQPSGESKLIDKSTPDRYCVVDSSDPVAFKAFATIEDGDEIVMLLRSVKGEVRSGLLSGSDQFDKILKHFAGRFKGIRGSWSYETNLDKFNELTGRGITPEEAALATWTGQQSAEHGYGRVVIKRLEGNPGAYQKVVVVFVR